MSVRPSATPAHSTSPPATAASPPPTLGASPCCCPPAAASVTPPSSSTAHGRRNFALLLSVEEVEPEEFQKRLENGSYIHRPRPRAGRGRQCPHRTGPVLPHRRRADRLQRRLYTTQLGQRYSHRQHPLPLLLAACERQLLEQAVAVPLLHPAEAAAVANGIEGLRLRPFRPGAG